MLGARGTRALLVDRLQTALPGKVTEMRARLGRTATQLPEPRHYVPREPGRQGSDRFPFVAVLLLSTDPLGGPERDYSTGTADRYQYRYVFHVFIMCAAGNPDTVDQQRDDLTLAIREVLLQRRGLGGDQEMVLEPESIVEAYSDVDADQARQSIAGCRLEVTYRVTETLAAEQPPVVPAAGPSTTVGRLP